MERVKRIPAGCFFAAVFGVAFLIRTVVLIELKDSAVFSILVADGYVYDTWAQQIAGGNWLGHEVFYQAPLYPYFLAVIYTLFGHDLLAVRIIQIFLGSASCLLLAMAGRSFFSLRVGILSGFLLALYAPALFFDVLIQKAALDLFFATLLLFLLGKTIHEFRGVWFAILGVVLGLFALTRENALILAPILGIWILFFFRNFSIQKRFLRVGLFLFGMILVLFPVGWRNRAVGGEFFITTSQFGPNFFIGNNEQADGCYAPLRWGRGSAFYERQDATELAENALGRKLSPREVSSYWTNQALDTICRQPGHWLQLMAKKWCLVWNVREIPDSEEPLIYYDESALLRFLAFFMHFGVICPLAIAGACVTWKDRGKLWLLYLMALSLAASVALFYVFARYRYPMVPILILFAAAGILEMTALCRGRKKKSFILYAVLILVSAIFINWKMTPNENPRATAYYNLAVGLEKNGKFNPSIAYYIKSLENKPDYAQAHINLGILLARQGELDAAVAHYLEALRIKPHNPNACNNLANALLRMGKLEEAIAYYAEAVSREPDNAIFQNNLANALEKAHRKER